MANIITDFWLNINVLEYPHYMEVNKKDADQLERLTRSYFNKIGLSALFAVGISFGRRKAVQALSARMSASQVKGGKIYREPYRKEDLTRSTADYVVMTGSKHVNKGEQPSEAVRIKSPGGTLREKYLPDMTQNSEKTRGFLFFKQFTNRKGNSRERVHSFLKNTKIIYLPLIAAILAWTYSYCIELMGYYCKYQPLVDSYYNSI